MKKITIVFLYVIALTFTVLSCSKDDDNTEKTPANYYSLGDTKITNISYAAYSNNSSSGYILILAQNVPTGDVYNYDHLYLEIPVEQLDGQKIDLSKTYSYGWFPYGRIRLGDLFYEWKDNNGYKLTGTDNWMKITKSEDNNFTIEVNLTVDGKLVKAYYKGKFQKIDR
ncbi:hypothetical protein [Flavobacterium ajazii]|uniref:hypothetical protein n=1 Tax=Flavobacterium ajazii TaxID=2692318 RepID=UPI0013D63733|nr:hypothetical protein [Flavobacterium ajazii]